MAYTMLHTFGPGHDWSVPGDIWSAYRSADYIAWGAYGAIYAVGTNVITFPGMLVVLAPVAKLTGALGLREDLVTIPHPTSWYVLGPYEIALSSMALFASDALADRLGVSRARRRFLCVAQAIVLWNVDVVWGHPEDAVAVALVIYALIQAFDGRWARVGWLMGTAVAMQPLVLLILPLLVFAVVERSKVASFLVRTIAPSVVLLTVPLISNFSATFHTIVRQPNYPLIDHITPWTSMAPKLGGAGTSVAVAAGPGRIVALICSLLLGIWARRWREDHLMVVWAAGICLALRCFTESVMVPFYIWPALAMCLLVAVRSARWRLGAAAVVGVAITIYSDYHLGPWWMWWSVVSFGLVAVLLLARPDVSEKPTRPDGQGRQPPTDDDSPALLGALE